MTFEIKRGEPIPERSGIAATMRKLAVGDSFVIPSDEIGKHTRKGLYSIAKRVGIGITTRKVDGGIKVWRKGLVEEPPEVKERFEIAKREIIPYEAVQL